MYRTDGKWGSAKTYFNLITSYLPDKLVCEDPDLNEIKEIIDNMGVDNDIYKKYSVSAEPIVQGSIENRYIYIVGFEREGYPFSEFCYDLRNRCYYDDSSNTFLDDIYIDFKHYNLSTGEHRVCTFEKKEDYIKKTIIDTYHDNNTEEVLYYDIEGNKINTKGNKNCKVLVREHIIILYE